VDLVNVECVQLGRAILDDPVFDVALLDDDVREPSTLDRTAPAFARRP
jgi:hypothetical protein